MISLRDKVFGCYLGAAVGDALGGPIQAMHAEKIRKTFGEIKELLHYRKPPGFFDLGPAYARHSYPGCVTGETFIRAQFARFVTDHRESRHLEEMVHHLYRYGDLTAWPEKMLRPLRQAKEGAVRPEMAGARLAPGDGLSWWTPLGIVNAGEPRKAFEETVRLSTLWKRPLEQDLLGAVQAGVAHALTPRARAETMIETACAEVGPLARELILRAVDIARAVPRGNLRAFVGALYEGALVDSAPAGLEGALPPPAPPPDVIDEPTASPLLAEQVPLAFAALAFGDGRSRVTLCAAASLGRDARAIAATAGSWVGALVGRSRLPREWVGAVVASNHADLDLVQQATALADHIEPELQL